MATVIIGQTYTITSTPEVSLVNAIVTVRYTTPINPTYQEISATIVDNYNINVTITSEINNVIGKYLFWLYITYTDNDNVYISKPIQIQSIDEGKLM